MATRRRRSPPPPSDSQYDYLLKIILLGPSGCGKTSLLHHFLHNQPLTLSSQTIGVEFATKIVTLDGPLSSSTSRSSYPHAASLPSPSAASTQRRPARRIKLQLWDTAGTERFRSVSRSYYRGAAGALLVYDVSSWRSFAAAGEFLRDARALGSRGLSVAVVGNKTDVDRVGVGSSGSGSAAASYRSARSGWSSVGEGPDGNDAPENDERDEYGDDEEDDGTGTRGGTRSRPREREVDADVARRWAAEQRVPLCVETSAASGDGVDDVFLRLARTILARIETGAVNPDDPDSGIQYGDAGGWGIFDTNAAADGRSVRSGMTVDDAGSLVGYGGRRSGGGKGGRQGAFKLGGWGDALGGNRGCC